MESLLQAISNGDALARGCVNIISVEAIRRSIGARWAARREQVWEHIQRMLKSRLSSSDTVERIGEVEFLVFIAVESGPVAQTVCLRALQEVLVHYLGAFELPDLTISTVTGVQGSTLSCVALDPVAVLQKTDAASPARNAPLDEAQSKGAASALAFMAKVSGYDLHFQIEDIISLRHAALAGGRIRRLVVPDGATAPLARQELTWLNTATLASIDMQTLAFATSLLQGESSRAYPSLSMPAALQTFGHSTSRAGYLQKLRALAPEDRRRVMVELVNLDEGTLGSRIGEAVSSLRGLCRGVSAFTDPTRRAMAALKNNNLTCIVVSTDQLAPPGGSLEHAIASFAEVTRGVAPITAIHGALLPSEVTAARDAGVTYNIDPARRGRVPAAA